MHHAIPGSPGRSRLSLLQRGGVAFQWAVVFAAAVLLVVYLRSEGATRQMLGDMFTIFLSIVLEALPFVIAGSLVGGFIEVFVPRDRVTALLSRRRVLAVFLSGFLGVIFPVCECAIIPVIRRVLRKGVPFSAAVAYLLAGPLVNPLVAGSTAVAYRGDWTVVALRLGIGYAVAVTAALVLGRMFPGAGALAPELGEGAREPDGCCAAGCATEGNGSFWAKIKAAFAHGSDDFLDVARFLVLGALFAGVLRGMIAEQTLLGIMVSNEFVAIAFMMLLAVLLNLCSEADAFVAASFRNLLPVSGQLAFMVLGPMLDIKLVMMYFSVFRKRTILAIVVVVPVLVFLAMSIVEILS
jgi:uncharacterized membrane protein YraQ (UPF0718 family)